MAKCDLVRGWEREPASEREQWEGGVRERAGGEAAVTPGRSQCVYTE